VSPAASAAMREIFASPDIPIATTSSSKADWSRRAVFASRVGRLYLDSAIVTGAGGHYITVAMTHHPREDYLVVCMPWMTLLHGSTR